MEANGSDGMPVFIDRNVFHIRADYFGPVGGKLGRQLTLGPEKGPT
jgi:hypothetical protein